MEERLFFVYMVLCADASYYIGITNSIDARVGQHNEGIDRHCYTYTRRPVQLVYAAEFANPSEAIAWEKQIKGWSRRKKDALVRGDWASIKRLAAE
ncbi:MAG TPA: GIY-YIG nuclease family protein [Candidatus Baltobacteraceae bacterium]